MKKNIIIFLVLIIVGSLISFYFFEIKDIMEYNSIIQEFQAIVTSVYSDSFEKNYNANMFNSPNKKFQYEWSCMIADMYSNRTGHSYGYILYDFDQNGIKELFLVRDDYFVLAIFTKQNSSSYMLDAFWSKHKCDVSSTGELYIFNSITAQDFNYCVKKYDHETTSLITTKSFGCDQGVYYEEINKKIITINVEKYIDLKCSLENDEFLNQNINIISPILDGTNTEDG